MSRIGRMPVPVPAGVTVAVAGQRVTVTGPRGTLEHDAHPDMRVSLAESTVVVERPSDLGRHRALHGLTRTLIANMVEGVEKGFTKELEIQGVGYRATARGDDVEIAVGYSHPVVVTAPAGVKIEVTAPTRLVVSGADKHLVGQVAANIRALRPPDSYKGKGIRYAGEYVRKKAGKAAK